MKKHFILSGIVMSCMVMVALVFNSCGSKQNPGNSVIPSDAPIVMEINMEKLTLKSNIANYKDQMADMLLSTDESNESVQQLAEAVRNMDDGGLNFHQPVYVFTTANVDGIFVLASVRKASEVKETVLKLSDERNRVIEDETDGLTWIEDTDHATLGVFNDEFLVIGTAKQKAIFEQLIAAQGDFFNTKMGRAMQEHAGDMTLMINAQAVDEDVMDMLRMRFMQGNEKISALFDNDEVWEAICKLQMVWNLKFSVGEVSINLYAMNEEPPTQKVVTKVDPKVFDNIPAEGLIGTMALGIDGVQLAEVLKQAVEQRGAEMDNSTRMGLNMLTTLCSAMNGSAAFSINMADFSKDPGIVVLLPIAQEKIQYIFNMLAGNTDKEVYLTGDNANSAISNKRAYQYGRVFPSFKMASHADGNYLYGYFDIQELIRLALASKHSSTLVQSDFDKAVIDYVQQFNYAEMKMAEINELSLILKLNDEKHNSLSVLLRSTFDLFIQYLDHREAQKAPSYVVDDEPWEEWENLEEVEEVAW